MMTSHSEFPETRSSLLLQLQTEEDDDAWREFVSSYRPVIYRLARKRGLQDADAQDLSQEVLVAIAGSISRWRKSDEQVRFRHWLRRVARNAIINALTRSPKDRATGGAGKIFFDEQVGDGGDLAHDIELEHRREIFFKAAAIVKSDVAADTWRVFELTVVEGVPIEEAAACVNKSVGAAYAARGRVMARLRQLVDNMEWPEA